MIREFLRIRPPRKGDEAPHLSLTADEGTWIRLTDFKDHLNVILYFISDINDGMNEDYLRELDRARSRFEQLDTAVFAVSTQKTDKLRNFRAQAGIEIFLIYDPWALTSRKFGACRTRQRIKDTVVLVAKDGTVALGERGRPDVERLLDICATLEGAAVPEGDGAAAASSAAAASDQSFARKPGKAADTVRHIDSKQALEMLDEDDSAYVLVDVRTKGEFEADHSPLAKHIPVDEIPHRYHEIGQTEHIIFICQMGGRSAAAGEFMTSIGGYEIYSVDGGMSSWDGERVASSN
jgi:rhodanese-related sulfurtransferase/peroxiredoxin